MKKIPFPQLNEQLYFEKLKNGLDVYILPKKGFHKTFATFTTKYGSIDDHFVPIGNQTEKIVPDGIAHFLEHKLFEKEDGDVFHTFSKQGASANAFTSFTRTAYLFSATSNVKENLRTLLDFVQEPYFTDQTVEKEKGIIGQEIQMYEDHPDWRLYFGTIENMYHHHPVKTNIAGTIESISHITKELLYECYHTFYHPSNMLLFIVGPVDPREILDFVQENQRKKSFSKDMEIQRIRKEEPDHVLKKNRFISMNVRIPKCMVGIKGNFIRQRGREMMKTELTVQLLLDMLFSKSSGQYEKLYNEGLIDDTFSADYTQEENFGFALVGGDTKDPDRLAEFIQKTFHFVKKGEILTEEQLNRVKKKKIGTFLRLLNSPEYIANQFTRYAFNGMNLFEAVPVLETITFEDLMNVSEQFIDENRMTSFQIVPK
ncbi:EF-P 5-aminopentanol modification-associated protein YfmH [Fervidibacillus halotolerans]|uniref:Insulinase family protein n=1 Tax=Fervidibacillus halotolerans TaxID=2980027 RepID=A0A9E8RZV2_9BACI|nr:pitrilysin family protein [Fervidibacillus halotolerans]WAA13544.1 insulinase family protein [Fervidibacillus halotolerans]